VCPRTALLAMLTVATVAVPLAVPEDSMDYWSVGTGMSGRADGFTNSRPELADAPFCDVEGADLTWWPTEAAAHRLP